MRPPIHENLAAARVRAGVSKRRLAHVLDINPNELSRAERGERHIRATELWDAAVYLGIDVSEFFAVEPKADAKAA